MSTCAPSPRRRSGRCPKVQAPFHPPTATFEETSEGLVGTKQRGVRSEWRPRRLDEPGALEKPNAKAADALFKPMPSFCRSALGRLLHSPPPRQIRDPDPGPHACAGRHGLRLSALRGAAVRGVP